MAAKPPRKSKGTPGRPPKKTNQFFDIGKVGRKTGITLEDKGVRDEHGLEPVSHIFSSPGGSPPKHDSGTLTSSEMHGQESSGPDVDRTLNSRKTPRLPPPRASTPRHTNIGSPKRASTGRRSPQRIEVDLEENGSPTAKRSHAPPNRVLDFVAREGKAVRKSIEHTSPFKPRHVLRRSAGSARADPFASPATQIQLQEPSEFPAQETIVEPGTDAGDETVAQTQFDTPAMVDDEDENEDDGYTEAADETAAGAEATEANESMQQTPTLRSNQSKKRARPSFEEGQTSRNSVGSASQLETSVPAQKKSRTSNSRLEVHQDDQDVGTNYTNYTMPEEDEEPYPEEPELEEEAPVEVVEEPPQASKAKGKKTKGKGKAKAAPKERDPNRGMANVGSPVKINDSPSKLRQQSQQERGSRAPSVGRGSNVNLRHTTPFDDANQRTSRFGRNLIQPLKYWANESRIYNHGECEGIIRADEIQDAGNKPQRKKKPKKSRKGASKLGDIQEESESESLIADEWEEEVGVISGQVANWNPATQSGNNEDLIHEDLAFAASSIVTRDVAGSDFKYAKIMTIPFFGAGVVELPPGGYKRAKNSRKMQMCFFVHEGKVMVEVGAANGVESSTFAIGKGGVWVVPRGNNYAINNESTSHAAKVFFSQGCEVDVGASGVSTTQ